MSVNPPGAERGWLLVISPSKGFLVEIRAVTIVALNKAFMGFLSGQGGRLGRTFRVTDIAPTSPLCPP